MESNVWRRWGFLDEIDVCRIYERQLKERESRAVVRYYRTYGAIISYVTWRR
jgi:hypothetical protein